MLSDLVKLFHAVLLVDSLFPIERLETISGLRRMLSKTKGRRMDIRVSSSCARERLSAEHQTSGHRPWTRCGQARAHNPTIGERFGAVLSIPRDRRPVMRKITYPGRLKRAGK